MHQLKKTNRASFLPVKATIVLAIFLLAFGIINAGFIWKKNSVREPFNLNANNPNILSADKTSKDSVESVKAFTEVYKVLMSPRCMNCHPAGDIPLQGDDSHLHNMSPQRGVDGKGVYAMKCANCHQLTNTPGVHTPPGNPKWHLPPSAMKMVFQGKSQRELALQIMDYKRNGHKNKQQLLEHARDTLVKAGWNMGESRTTPPLTYNDFVAAWDTWIKKGGYAPKK